MTMLLEIANWEDNFEIAQSRRRGGRLSWVAMPTRHDSRGYRKLLRSKNGVSHFACWVTLVQLAARCEVRGTLASGSGVALTFEDFENMTDIPASKFEAAIPVLCDIGWLCYAESEHGRSAVGADSEHGTTTVHNITVQNKTRQDSTLQDLKNAHRNIQVAEARKVYEKIPSRKRRGAKSFYNSYISEVIENDVPPETVIDALVEYYKSAEGNCPFFREPTRLLDDNFWQENQESWTRKDRAENSNAATDQEQLASVEHLFEEQT